jgi:Phosphopantetheine attachment site
MNSYLQTVVHHAIACQLRLEDASIEDAHTFEELRMDPLDLVLVVLRLEDLDRGQGDFPLTALADAKTVGDLVLLADLWLQQGTTPGSGQSLGPQRRSVA